MKNQPKFYLKIIAVLVLTFIISQFFVNEVFIAKSPVVRPDLVAYLAGKIGNPFSGFIARQPSTGKEEDLSNVPFHELAKGVSAKSKGNTSLTVIKINQIDWVVYTVKVRGVTRIVRIPKGQALPPQTVIDKLN